MPETFAPPRPTGEQPHTDQTDQPEAANANPADAPEQPTPAPDAPQADQDKESFKVVFAGLDKNADDFAREAGLESFKREKLKQGPIWKRVARNVWLTLTEEYQQVKKIAEARGQIFEHNNLRHHQGESDQKWREGVVRRFGSEYGEHLIHEDAGETFHKLNSPEAQENSNAQRIQEDTRDLLRKYAEGTYDKDSLEEAYKRMVQTWRDKNISQDFIGEGYLLATNVLEMAEQVKAALDATQGLANIDRDTKLDELLSKVEVVTGEARVGSRVEVDPRLSERLAEKMRNVPFVNESRIAKVTSLLGNELVVAGMLSAALAVSKKPLSVIPGIGAAIVAGVRERRTLKDERALAGRKLDAGEATAARVARKKGRREKGIETSQLETVSAGELLDAMSLFYDQSGKLNIPDANTLNLAIQIQADIKARQRIEDAEGRRLIDYAGLSADQLEETRTDLELALAKLETDVAKLLEDPAEAARLGVIEGETFQDLLNVQKWIITGALETQITEKDRAFNKFARGRILMKSIFVGLSAAAGAEALQHVAHAVAESGAAAFVGHGPKLSEAAYTTPDGAPSPIPHPADTAGGIPHPGATAGNIPHPADTAGNIPNAGNTAGNIPHPGATAGNTVPQPEPAAGNIPHPGDTAGNIPRPGATAGNIPHPGDTAGEGLNGGHSAQIAEHSKVNLPEGYNSQVNGNHVTITGPNGAKYDLQLNQDGTISQDSLNQLQQHGMQVIDHQETVQGPPNITEKNVTADEFVQNHQADMVKIKHDGWLDSANQQRADNAVMPNGDIKVSVDRMTAGGSFHGNTHVDWHEAARQGKLKLWVSASDGSQASAIELKFNSDGTLIIPNGSPAHALFDAHGNFHGGYQNIAVEQSVDKDGTVHILNLATIVGDHHAGTTFHDTVSTPTYATGHAYTIRPGADMQPSAQKLPGGGGHGMGFGDIINTILGTETVLAAGAVGTAAYVGRRSRRAAAASSGPGGPTAPGGPTGPSGPAGTGPTSPPPGPTGPTGPTGPSFYTGPTPGGPTPGSTGSTSGPTPGSTTGGGGSTGGTSTSTGSTAGAGSTGTGGGSSSGTTGGAGGSSTGSSTGGGSGSTAGAGGSSTAGTGGGSTGGSSTSTGSTGSTAGTGGGSTTSGGGSTTGGSSTGSSSTGNGTGQQTQGGQQKPGPTQGPKLAPEDQAIFDRLDADTRAVPTNFRVDFSGLNAREQKMAIAMMHEIIAQRPQGNGESATDWHSALLKQMRNKAAIALNNLDATTLSPVIKPIMKKAFGAILLVR